MFARIVNLLLLIAILVGGVLAFQADQRYRTLRSQLREASEAYGYLDVKDPSKATFRALRTDDPMFFRWRLYLPEDHSTSWRHPNGSSRNSGASSSESLVLVRFREEPSGIRLFQKQPGGASENGLYDKRFAEFIRGRWNELKITQAGVDETVVVEPDQIITLLEIEMPPSLHEEFKQQHPQHQISRSEAPVRLYYREFGETAAFEKRDEARKQADKLKERR